VKNWRRNLTMTAAVIASAIVVAASLRTIGSPFWGAFLCHVLAGVVIGLNLRIT